MLRLLLFSISVSFFLLASCAPGALRQSQLNRLTPGLSVSAVQKQLGRSPSNSGFLIYQGDKYLIQRYSVERGLGWKAESIGPGAYKPMCIEGQQQYDNSCQYVRSDFMDVTLTQDPMYMIYRKTNGNYLLRAWGVSHVGDFKRYGDGVDDRLWGKALEFLPLGSG